MSARLGITTGSTFRTAVLRAIAMGLAAFGVYSCLEWDIGSKLLMQMSLLPGDFGTATPAFFAHHIAIVGLYASLAHYSMVLLKSIRGRRGVAVDSQMTQ